MKNGEKLRAEVARKLNDWDSDNHQNIKFLLRISNFCIKEVMNYVKVCNRIEAMLEAEKTDDTSILKKVLDHKGLLNSDSQIGKIACTISKSNRKIIV